MTPVPDSVVYDFYQDRGNIKVRDEAAGIKEAYDAGELNWRLEAADNPYQFRPSGSNEFLPAYDSMKYFTSTSSNSRTRFIAVRIQSPGAGKYDLTLTHGAGTDGIKNGIVYVVDAALIDEALGANAEAYAQAIVMMRGWW